MDRVLIIIVTYNAHGWIRQCIGSVDRQRYDVLVVDNASGDDTVGIIRTAYPDVRLFVQTENLGFGQANNIGLRYAVDNAYDYVLLLNQDAWLLPDTIEKLIIAHKQQPQYWILSPMQMNKDNTGLEHYFQYIVRMGKIDCTAQTIQEIDFVNAAIWLLPVATIRVVGGFNPIFPHYGEDNDYVHRVLYKSGKIGILPTAFGHHVGNLVCPSENRRPSEYRFMLSFIGQLTDLRWPLPIAKLQCMISLMRKILKDGLSANRSARKVRYKACLMAMKQMGQIKKVRQQATEEGAFL